MPDSVDKLALPSAVENGQEVDGVRAPDLSARIDAAFKMVHALCTREREWMMSIPARPDYDPDLVIAAGLQAGRDAIKRLAELKADGVRLDWWFSPEVKRCDLAGYLRGVRDGWSRDQWRSWIDDQMNQRANAEESQPVSTAEGSAQST